MKRDSLSSMKSRRHLLVDPPLDVRVTTLEAIVETTQQAVEQTNRNVDRLVQTVQQQSEQSQRDFRELGREFQASRVPDFRVWIAAATLMIIFVGAVGGMIITPMRQAQNGIQVGLDKVEAWQMRYMMGEIPSSAVGEIAALKMHFEGEISAQRERDREQKTQFRFWTKETDRNTQQIEDLRKITKDSGIDRARLDERLKHTERSRERSRDDE